ncbi:MAG TPA: hypothetical protein VK386_07770, partial [Acidimicrobiales bacterium]|nr:hypothetical protein [Acidimicrobiales bacterium]
MSKHTTRLGTVALLCTVSVAALSASPSAAGTAEASTASSTSTSVPAQNPSDSSTPPSLAQVQAKAAAEITKRVDSLDAAVSKVNAHSALGADAATLDAYLQQDITPLQNLGDTIAADTTVGQARADFRQIFTDYRVYVLVLPAARQAARADAITVTALPKLTSVSVRAQQFVDAQNQATLEPMIDSLNDDVSGAQSASSGVAATVLGYTPSQWNADHSLLSSTKASLQTAVAD